MRFWQPFINVFSIKWCLEDGESLTHTATITKSPLSLSRRSLTGLGLRAELYTISNPQKCQLSDTESFKGGEILAYPILATLLSKCSARQTEFRRRKASAYFIILCERSRKVLISKYLVHSIYIN